MKEPSRVPIKPFGLVKMAFGILSLHTEGMMNKILFLVPVIGLILSGCETAEGFGRDLKKAGAAIERKASRGDDVSQPPESKKTHYYDR